MQRPRAFGHAHYENGETEETPSAQRANSSATRWCLLRTFAPNGREPKLTNIAAFGSRYFCCVVALVRTIRGHSCAPYDHRFVNRSSRKNSQKNSQTTSNEVNDVLMMLLPVSEIFAPCKRSHSFGHELFVDSKKCFVILI
jgi:hypothetical protein